MGKINPQKLALIENRKKRLAELGLRSPRGGFMLRIEIESEGYGLLEPELRCPDRSAAIYAVCV